MSALQDFDSARASGLVANADRYLDWQIAEQTVDGPNVVMTSTMDFAAVELVDANGQVVQQVGAWSDVQFAWTLQRQDDDSWVIVQGQQLP